MKKIFNPLIHIDFAKYKYLTIKDKRDFKKKVIKCIKITEGKKNKSNASEEGIQTEIKFIRQVKYTIWSWERQGHNIEVKLILFNDTHKEWGGGGRNCLILKRQMSE